jgi:hypothetical protein
LFHSARWKAYLHKLQDDDAAGDGSRPRSIYHIFHSQKIWFTQEQKNGHGESAEANLKRSDDLLEDCTNRVEALEETLANTPKPSEVLDWGQLW